MKSNSTYIDYPSGMVMPGRHGQAENGYRYGFQGQEKDDEVKGEGNCVNYKYRMHDPRIGRFFAVDPLAPKYPHNSPYAFSENRVTASVELEGLEAEDLNSPAGQVIKRGGPFNGFLLIPEVNASAGNVKTMEAAKQGYAKMNSIQKNTYLNKYKKYWDSPMVDENVRPFNRNAYDKQNLEDNIEKGSHIDIAAGMVGVALAPLMLPSLIEGAIVASPYLVQTASFVGKTGMKVGATAWKGAKLYHNTFGKNGGYESVANNVYDQSVSQLVANGGLNFGNYDLISLGTSSLLTKQSSFVKQLAQSHSSTLYSYTINKGGDGMLVRKMSGGEILIRSAIATLAPLRSGTMPIVERHLAPVLNGGVDAIFEKKTK